MGKSLLTLALAGLAGLAGLASAQTIDPYYSGNYSFVDLGSIIDLPANYGGLTTHFTDPNTIIIGGAANTANGVLYQVGVTRDGSNHITGFSTPATFFASGEYNDGGVSYHSSGVLFASRWPVNEIGQYKPGSVAPDKIINLAALGVASSNAAVSFGGSQFTFSGRMKLSSWGGGQFYDAIYSPDGNGTFDITSVTQTATLGGGPEGFQYVPLGSVLFPGQNMIVSEYSAGQIATYEVDNNGDPLTGTRRTFMSGLTGAEGALIDPLTGDFLFSTFGGGNRVIRVSGFVPEPATWAVMGLGVAALVRRRRKK